METVHRLVEQIYESKCTELRIDNQDVLRGRFLQAVCNGLSRGVLDLSNQQLRSSTIPYVVELIRALGSECTELVLDNNPIMDDGCLLLLDCFEQLRNYRVLSLVSVGLNPDGLINFLAPFGGQSELYELRLGSNPSAERRNRFSEDSCRFLGEFVSACKTLRVLDFTNSQLRTQNGYTLFKALNDRTNLEQLVLVNTGVNDAAIQQMCVQKAHFLLYINSLDLSGNQTLTDAACPALANFIGLQRRFTTLKLKECTNLAPGLPELFKALVYPSAERLALQEEKERMDKERTLRRTEKLKELGPGVKNLLLHDKVIVKGEGIAIKSTEQKVPPQNANEFTTALQYLDLSGIKFGAVQLMALATCMEKNDSIVELILDDCGLDFGREDLSAQMEVLCTNLGRHKCVERLCFAHNTLNEGAANFLQFLLLAPKLSSLDLSFTRIGDETVRKLAGKLPESPALTHLNLHGNNCEQDGALALQIAVQKCPRLQSLDLTLNKVKFQLAEKLSLLVKQNVEQSCADVFQTLQNQHNELQAQLASLQRTDQELQQNLNKEQQLMQELKAKTEELITTNQNYEEQLEALRMENDRLNKQQTTLEGEQQAVQAQNNEIQGKIDQDQAVYESKRKQLKEKQATATARITEIDQQIAVLQQDTELQALQKELDRKKKEKENAEKEAVAFLAQLAAIEAVLIKNGAIQVQAAKK